MVDVADKTHLIKRGNTWHYQRRVPTAYVDELQRTLIKKSLGTSDLAEARKRRNIENIVWDRKFAELEKNVAGDIVSQLKRETKALSADDVLEYVRSYVTAMDKNSAHRLIANPFTSTDERDECIEETEHEQAILKDPSDPQLDYWIGSLICELAKANRIEIDLLAERPETPEYIRQGLLELALRRMDRYNDRFNRPFHNRLFDPALPPQLRFGTLIALYLEEKEQEQKINSVGLSRTEKIQTIAQTFRELVNENKVVSSIDADFIREIRTDVARLPANRNKIYPNIPIREAIEKAERDGKRPLAPITQSEYLAIFKEILDVAVRKKALGSNPADGIKPLKRDTVSNDQRRDALTPEQLRRFFTGSFYRECAEPTPSYLKPDRAWRFWLPLLMLFSGCRPLEICQLRLDDIKVTEGGTHYLDIVRDGGDTSTSLKTNSSRRKLPLHPALKNIGFLDFVERRKKNRSQHGERLFHELKPDKDGNRAAYATKRLREWLRDEVLLEKRQAFYSIRHSVRDALRRIHAPAEALEAIGGWAQGRQDVSSNYGDAKNPDIIVHWVEQIRYPGLDLGFLEGVGGGI